VNKSAIRKKILDIRKEANKENFSISFKKLIKILKKKKIKNKILGGYFSFNHEIEIVEILKKFEKKNYIITLPKIKKNFQMDFFEWSEKEPLLINNFGIPEPLSNKIRYPDVIFVPIVAFDKNFNRIGYGGGFYDRYLRRIKKRKKKVLTIGLAYSFQKVKKIPITNHDIKLDFIVTEKDN